MTADISASLNVVSIAALFCASLSLTAMVCRSRVMRTRSSRPLSLTVDGTRSSRLGAGGGGACAGTCTRASWAGAGVSCAGAALELSDVRFKASVMSSFRICPRRPDPTTSSVCSPASARYLRAAGLGGVCDEPFPPECGFAAGSALAGAAALAGASAGLGALLAAAGGGEAAAPPSDIDPSTAPIATAVPCCAMISAS